MHLARALVHNPSDPQARHIIEVNTLLLRDQLMPTNISVEDHPLLNATSWRSRRDVQQQALHCAQPVRSFSESSCLNLAAAECIGILMAGVASQRLLPKPAHSKGHWCGAMLIALYACTVCCSVEVSADGLSRR